MAFAGIPQDNVNNAISSVISQTIIITLVIAAVIAVIIFIFAKSLSDKLGKASDSLSVLASGDLTQPIDDNNNIVSEINSIVSATHVLREQLSTSVGDACSTAVELQELVGRVSDSSDKSARETAQISQSVNELSAAAQSMADAVQSANADMIDMGNAISDIHKKTEESSNVAVSMNVTSGQAVDIMNKVDLANQHSASAIVKINKLTMECAQAVEQIKMAADVIQDIANQTNLLALNASIESARAGEAGKGFSVVAESIKNLAGQSGDSASEISEYVYDIVEKVEQCVNASKQAEELMEQQNELVAEASGSMNSLREYVEAVSANINDISSNAGNLDKAKNRVLNSITDLSAISEENAANSTEVNEAVGNIAEGIENTKKESGIMKDLAVALGDKMKVFKIN